MTIAGSFLGRAVSGLWSSPSTASAVARAVLLVPAGLYRAAVVARNAAYDAGLLRAEPLPLPSVGIGNLAVGGTGKSPLARLVAAELEARGARVGLLLRGYGADEVVEHREALPGAIVVADPDRHRGAAAAQRQGAQVLVLDDCLQHRRVAPDLMLAVVAAESVGAPPWPLPAGPWRESYGALGRADAVVVTHKSAGGAEAAALADRLARRTRRAVGLVAALRPTHLVALGGEARRPIGEALAGRHVLALCGIGAPGAFADQLRAAGAASVDLAAFGDHHAYDSADVEAVRRRADSDTLIVTTAKDAVKLRAVWPTDAPPYEVAVLTIDLGRTLPLLADLLDGVVARASAPATRPARSTAQKEP